MDGLSGDAVVIHDEMEFVLPLKPVQQQLLPTDSDKSIRIHTASASRLSGFINYILQPE